MTAVDYGSIRTKINCRPKLESEMEQNYLCTYISTFLRILNIVADLCLLWVSFDVKKRLRDGSVSSTKNEKWDNNKPHGLLRGSEDGGNISLRNVGIYLVVPHIVTTHKTNIVTFTAMRDRDVLKFRMSQNISCCLPIAEEWQCTGKYTNYYFYNTLNTNMSKSYSAYPLIRALIPFNQMRLSNSPNSVLPQRLYWR